MNGCRRLLELGAYVLFALGLGAIPASAVTVQVSPVDTTVAQGDTWILRVVTQDAVADLKAYQLVVGLDPSAMQFLGATPGDVLTGPGGSYQVFVTTDSVPPADTLWIDCAMLDGSAAGPGVLVYLRFKALDIGTWPVACHGADFRDSFNHRSLPACESASVTIEEGVTPARASTWGRLKRLYR